MFQGFDPAAIDFLWGLRFNNDRSWFEPRKEEFRTLLDGPMKELCRELYEGLSQKHRDLPLMSKVSRIYRDARRLFGRGPYKDHLWLVIHAPADSGVERPCFWFELAPEYYSFGLGYWVAEAVTMAKFRARMDRDPKPMERMARALSRQQTFSLTGEDFKKKKQAPSPLLEPWYNKKRSLAMECTRNHDELLWSPRLVPVLLEEWEKLVPLYRYLVTLDGDPDPRGMNTERLKMNNE